MPPAPGAQIGARYGHAVFDLGGPVHQRRARTLADRLLAVPGVLEADVSAQGQARVEFDREQVDEAAIRLTFEGKDARPTPAGSDHAGHDHGPGEHGDHGEGHTHEHGGIFGATTEIIFALACGLFLAVGFAIDKLIAGRPEWLPLAFYLAAYGCGGYFTLREAIDNLRFKRFEIDTLMLVAAGGAAALGAWAEGALLLFLFSMGHSLEHYAMGRAKRAIEALAELAPQTALVRRDGHTVDIRVEQLTVGDVAIVKPNERMPADGFVLVGTSSVNQAPSPARASLWTSGRSMIRRPLRASPMKSTRRIASCGHDQRRGGDGGSGHAPVQG